MPGKQRNKMKEVSYISWRDCQIEIMRDWLTVDVLFKWGKESEQYYKLNPNILEKVWLS